MKEFEQVKAIAQCTDFSLVNDKLREGWKLLLITEVRPGTLMYIIGNFEKFEKTSG